MHPLLLSVKPSATVSSRIKVTGVASSDLVLWNARVIDGRSRAPQDRMCVIVRDKKIQEVRAVREPKVPNGALDLNGRYVMPGLIDAHIHLTADPAMWGEMAGPPPRKGEDPRARELIYFALATAARAFLRSGVTTLRDVGCHDDNAIILREAIRLGLTEGPRILSCGRIISATAPGARHFHTMYEEADGPWEMRRSVRNQLRRGADYIKVMAGGARSVLREDSERPQLTKEEMEALVDEAHRLGLRVAAHAEGLEPVRLAVEAGVDTVEHGLSLHRAPELLDQMARSGTVLVPTLSTFHDVGTRFAERWTPDLVEQAKRQEAEAHLTLIAARDAGVTLAMGFDSGPPGADALELLRMVEGGLTPHEGIMAATTGSARALGLDDVGTVEPGMTADLVVLNSDPLADVTRLTRAEEFWMVVRDGRVVVPASA
jgi:imidazolonepropionase-like amidohydrolase